MRRLLALVLVVAASACESLGSVGPGKTGEHLSSSGSSPLIAPLDTAYVARVPGDTSFWAYRGRSADVVLRYTAPPGSAPGDTLLEFTLASGSLVRYPDGTAFGDGDSVLITIRPDTTGHMAFVFEPSGLVFDSTSPAVLRMWCTHAAADLNGDGVVNATDEQLWYEMALWLRETALDPWTELTTTRSSDGEQLWAPVTGFTGFSVAS